MNMSALRSNSIPGRTGLIAATLLVSILLFTGIGGCLKGNQGSTEYVELIGVWTGEGKFRLTVKQKDDLSELYNMSEQCKLSAKYYGIDHGVHKFFLQPQGGGAWCDARIDGEMTLKLKNRNTLDMNIKNKDKTIDETAELTKQ